MACVTTKFVFAIQAMTGITNHKMIELFSTIWINVIWIINAELDRYLDPYCAGRAYYSNYADAMCTKAEVDWTNVDSDHAWVQIWLDICKKAPFKINGSLLEDPVKLTQAKAQIDTMMQQIDPTWNPHQKLEFSKLCVRTTLSQIGQITSSIEKQ